MLTEDTGLRGPPHCLREPDFWRRPLGERVLKPVCELPRDPDHGHKNSDSGKWLEFGQRRPELKLPVRGRDHVSPPLWLDTHHRPPWLPRDADHNPASSKAPPDSVSSFSRIISVASRLRLRHLSAPEVGCTSDRGRLFTEA